MESLQCCPLLTLSDYCDIGVAGGTLLLAVAAIYGEWLKAKLLPPRARLELRSALGDPTHFNRAAPNEAMFYHIRVVNKRSWLPITNCRVWLKALQRRVADGSFQDVPMSVPLELKWAPAEANERFVTIVTERILDLGHVSTTYKKFIPAARTISNNFKGFVEKNQAVRFGLWIDATNYSSPELIFFEVSWDGEWSHDPETFSHHLVVKKV